MAHYIAELMEEVESAETDGERQTASHECADLIARLWALQTEQKTTELQRKLWNVIRLPNDELDLEALSNAMQNPPRNEDFDLETWSKLFRLVKEAEDWIWRISAFSVTGSDDAEEFSVEDFLQKEKAPDLVAKLAQVFPEFTDLDILNTEDVQARVSEAMRKLYILRSSLERVLKVLQYSGGMPCQPLQHQADHSSVDHPSHAKVRSTIQRFGNTTKPFLSSERLTTSNSQLAKSITQSRSG
jgi:hypothetical protein